MQAHRALIPVNNLCSSTLQPAAAEATTKAHTILLHRLQKQQFVKKTDLFGRLTEIYTVYTTIITICIYRSHLELIGNVFKSTSSN